MAVYRIAFTKSARKEFNALSAGIREKVLEVLTFLSHNPFSEFLRVKKLKGATSLYRIRVGDYRVVYEIRGNILTIIIIKIGHRREVYRNL